ncbi:MAG: hypothetical protein U0K87_00260, partial [Ruminococcus sp.]|nr:hypothetical protein [Ruminococcus sp.]
FFVNLLIFVSVVFFICYFKIHNVFFLSVEFYSTGASPSASSSEITTGSPSQSKRLVLSRLYIHVYHLSHL